MKTTTVHQVIQGISLYSMLFLLLILSACDHAFDLDEDPGKSQLVSLPYEDLAELELAMTGVYHRLWSAFRMNTAFATAWSGDDLTTFRAGSKIDFREYDQRTVSPRNSRTAATWRSIYRAVLEVNNVLKNTAQTKLTDQAAQDRWTGEAHFIRGFLFFHLSRNHGRIPLVLDVVPDYEIGLASQEDVYLQIERDFLQAEALLPASSNIGASRPNAGSARAFLARLYLDWAGFPAKNSTKYAEAASSAKKVIDNAEQHGFALVEDMASLYTIAGSKNQEGIFTLSHCESCGFANRKYGKLGLPSEFGGWHESFAEIRFFEDFPEGPRKEATFHTKVPLDVNGRVTADVANASRVVSWTAFRGQQSPLYRKIVGPFEDGDYSKFNTSRSDYFMRYAEVLLIYAEASGRSGSVSASAWEALNMVRRRAEGLPLHLPDSSVDVSEFDGAIEELAYTERKWELAGEFLRWYDLVRLERVEAALGGDARNPRQTIGTIYDNNGNPAPFRLRKPWVPILGPLDTDTYLHPIPPGEILLLPNLGG